MQVLHRCCSLHGSPTIGQAPSGKPLKPIYISKHSSKRDSDSRGIAALLISLCMPGRQGPGLPADQRQKKTDARPERAPASRQ